MNTTADRILEQGKALVRSIEALKTIEPTGALERGMVWLLRATYRRRLRAILGVARGARGVRRIGRRQQWLMTG